MFTKFIIYLLFIKFLAVLGRVGVSVPKSELTDRPSSLISLKTDLGTIVGYRKEVENRTINVFYGVPYAVPPINELRFKKSRIINKFPEEPYSALNFKPHCAQSPDPKYHPADKFSEDCLYANIFTPDLESNKIDGICKEKFNVMVYLYGNTCSIYQMIPFLDRNNKSHLTLSGDHFAALHNTILVTLNFRADLFSSLYLENEFHGNLALFDQNLAFQWIKQHIGDYCGDDRKLTLVGHSQGARAAGLHLVSKYSKDLFNNAIMQSFSPFFMDILPATRNEVMINSFLAINDLKCLNLSNRAVTDYIDAIDEKLKFKFFKFFNEKAPLKQRLLLSDFSNDKLRFPSSLHADNIDKDEYIDKDILELIKFLSKNAVDLECLQNLTTEQIIGVDKIYTGPSWTIYYDFDFINKKAYLDYKLFNKLDLNPNLNLLIGTTEEETCKKYFPFIKNYPNDQFNAPVLHKNEAKEIIKNTSILSTDRKGFGLLLADYYTNETELSLPRGYFDSIANLFSDYTYNCPVHFFSNYAALTAKSVSVYHITQKATKHFGAYSDFQIDDYDLNDYYWLGPCHADELNYLFGAPFRVANKFTDLDRSFSLKLLELWTSFASHGKMPNLHPSNKEWPTSNKHKPRPRCVEINEKYTREREFEQVKRCEQFWRPFLPSYKK